MAGAGTHESCLPAWGWELGCPAPPCAGLGGLPLRLAPVLTASLWPSLQLKVPTTDKPAVTVNFRKLLLNRCQKEFEKDKDDDEIFEKKQKEMDETVAVSGVGGGGPQSVPGRPWLPLRLFSASFPAARGEDPPEG